MIGGEAHVLVVDDQAASRKVLKRILERDCYVVEEAANGQEALDAVQRRPPDLILLDLLMPGLDGFGVLEQLKIMPHPYLPVIAVTVLSDRETRLKVLACGATEILSKPIDTDEVTVRVASMLALKKAHDAAEIKAEDLERLVAERTRELESALRQREEAIEALRRSDSLLREAQAIARIGSWERNLLTGAAIWSDELYRLLGYTPGEVEPTRANVLARVHPDDLDRLRDLLEQAELGDGPSEWDVKVVQPGEKIRILHVRVDIERKPSGRAGRTVGTCQDVTEQRLAAQELERLRGQELQALRDTDRMKDEFLSVLSHELRTPLNFIAGFASVLQDEVAGSLNPKQQEYLAKIQLGADRMLGIVNNVMDASQVATGRFTLSRAPADFGDIVRQAVSALEPLAVAKDLSLGIDVRVRRTVNVDGQRLGQVMMNLLDNAIKFTPEGGTVRVRARIEGDSVFAEVSDTGIGIAEQDLPHVFRPFSQVDMSDTRSVGGAGLGLGISKAIVDAHGGQMGVVSNPGKGSTFWFSVPAGPPTPVREALVVEDKVNNSPGPPSGT